MVISFFKVNRPASVLALPFIALILWALALYSPSLAPPEYGGPVYDLLYIALKPVPWLGVLIALLLVLLGAILVNRLATAQEVLNSTSLVTGLCYVMLMSLAPSQTMLTPQMIANVFLLLILNKLIRSYRKDTAYNDLFDIGFLLGLATLFYLPSFVFMPLVWVGLLMIRPFVWREWIIGLIGFILAFAISGTLFFLFNRLDTDLWQQMIPGLLAWPWKLQLNNAMYFTLGVITLLMLLSALKIYGGVTYSILRARKNINLLLWFLCFSLLSLMFAPVFNAAAFSFAAIPGAVFLSNYFLGTRRNGWVNFLFYLLCACSLIHHAVKIF